MFQSHSLWIAALLTTGVAGGLIYNWPTSSADDASAQAIADTPQTNTEGLPAVQHQQGLTLTETSLQTKTRNHDARQTLSLDSFRQGDRLLLGGNAIGAYEHYRRLPTDLSTAADSFLSLRMGLAAEHAGFLDQAQEHFSDTVANATNGSADQIWGLIGTARLWIAQNRFGDAARLLSELYLMSANDDFPVAMKLAISQQLSDVMQKQCMSSSASVTTNELQRAPPKPIQETNELKDQLQYFWCEPSLEPMLADSSWRRRESAPNDEEPLTIVQRPIADVALVLVSLHSGTYPLSQLIEDIQRAASIQIRLSASARSAIAGRSVHLDAVAMPVSILLDQTLGAHSLVWTQTDGVVDIVHRDERDPDQQARFDLQRTQRMQRQLQLEFPNGIQRVAALMHDANNSFLLDDYDAAAQKYAAAGELEPTGELNAKLLFNTATFELFRGDHESALANFYLALDQTLSPSLQAMAYSWIGEIEIRIGRPERAITSASRGLRLASHTSDENRALMTLAKAYLLTSDAYSANQVLFNHASNLRDPQSRRLATVLSTHARFQVIKPTDGLQSEGERLVLSLAALKPNDPRDFVEHLMVSRAFAAVGFRSKAIEHLTWAADHVPVGYWQTRIPLELAEVLYDAGDSTKAIETLQSVGHCDDPSLKIRKLFLENEIRSAIGTNDRVQVNCQELLAMPLSESNQKRALQMLGEAYQRSGKHYSAALCFAGLLPESLSETQTNPAPVTRSGAME